MTSSASATQPLLDWLRFVIFNVLPTAFSQFGLWAYEWQTLEAGILAIVAAVIWGQAIVRAAELKNSARWSFPESLQPLERPVSTVAEDPMKTDLRETRLSSVQPSSSSALHGIRSQVRTTLGQVPSTGDPLSSQQLKQCQQVGAIEFDPTIFEDDEVAKNKASLLQLALRKLADLQPGTSSEIAWQRLVDVNRCALSLEKTTETVLSGQRTAV